MHELYIEHCLFHFSMFCTRIWFFTMLQRGRKSIHSWQAIIVIKEEIISIWSLLNSWKLSSVDFMKATHQQNNNINLVKQIIFLFLVFFYPDIMNRICQKIDNPQTLPPTPVFNCLFSMPLKYDYCRHKTLINASIPLQLL